MTKQILKLFPNVPEAPVLLLEIGKQRQREKKEALSVIRENLRSVMLLLYQ